MVKSLVRGGSRGGGSWGSGPLPPLWGTPKLHKEGKKVVCARANTALLVLNSCPDPPPSDGQFYEEKKRVTFWYFLKCKLLHFIK